MIEGSGLAGAPHKYKSISYKLAATVVASTSIVESKVAVIIAAIRVRYYVCRCRARLKLIDQVIVLVSLGYGKVECAYLASQIGDCLVFLLHLLR